jgi:membrane protease subunit HflC
MKSKSVIAAVIVAVVTFFLFQSLFLVQEGEQAIITEFGAPVGEPITSPGVHFKMPFTQDVRFFDKRFIEWDGDPNQVPTADKKFIFVDTFARWQISDALQFYKRLRDERGAQSRLDDILDGETRNAIASHDLLEIVRSSNRTPLKDDNEAEGGANELGKIQLGRSAIEKMILAKANERTKDLGIVILDFRIKRLNYVQEVREKVYDRMISERKRIADKFRSEGQGEASRINGEKERKLKEISSEAERKAAEIMGKADAEAAAIYARAYNRTPQAKELYSFLRTLEAYEKTFDANTSIVLSTDSDFFRLLKDSGKN